MHHKEEKKERRGQETYLKMAEHFSNLVKKIDMEVQKMPNKINPKWPTPRHIIIKMQKKLKIKRKS